MEERRREEEDNLISLAELSEEALLGSISDRYSRGRIYTDVGDILVAVNPFRELGSSYYGEEVSIRYSRSGSWERLPPHVYGLAARAFTGVLHSKKDQVCVISGESGAGKTESSKLVMQQLIRMSQSSSVGKKLQKKITKLDPVLEAFGNAQTTLNSNSSRFGKFIQVYFSPLQGCIVGASIEHYLLEKSRVCHQNLDEQNFHIFYHLLYGCTSELIFKTLKLEKLSHYRYLPLNDIGLHIGKDSFDQIEKSMREIGFEWREILQIIAILAAILHIGDIEFGSKDDDSAVILNKEVAETVTELLGLESVDDLSFALTTLRTVTRGETVDKLYTPSKASDTRDAMAKELYYRLFSWLVARINIYLNSQDSAGASSIGILDIFGFESFQVNSFEQLCINLANEQLQQYFNEQIFAMEKEEYEKEGLEGVAISYQSNQPVLDLILSRPVGLMSLIDEQCRMTTGRDEAIVQLCKESFKGSPVYRPHHGNKQSFTIKHYAGDVEYQANGFVDKNKDALPDPVQGVLKFSSTNLVKTLFTHYPDFTAKKPEQEPLKPSQRSQMKRMSVRRSTKRKKTVKGRKKKVTVGAIFRDSLCQLMEKLLSASPHFIRCIKPNLARKPHTFDNSFVLKQLRYTGMVEAVRVRKEGFSYRPYFSDFVQDYMTIAFRSTDKSIKLSKENCVRILERAQLTDWKIGKSRVFLRYYHKEKLNSLLHTHERSASVIQKVFRGYKCRESYWPLREKQTQERLKIKAMMATVVENSERTFQLITELNKDDILNAIERFGHPEKGKMMEEKEKEKESDGPRKFRAEAINAVKVFDIRPEDIPMKKKESNPNPSQPRKKKISPPIPPKPNAKVLLNRRNKVLLGSSTDEYIAPLQFTAHYAASKPAIQKPPASIRQAYPPLVISDKPSKQTHQGAVSSQLSSKASPIILPMQTTALPKLSFYDDEDKYGYTLMYLGTMSSSQEDEVSIPPRKLSHNEEGGQPMKKVAFRNWIDSSSTSYSSIDSSTGAGSSNDSDSDCDGYVLMMPIQYGTEFQQSQVSGPTRENSLRKTSSLPNINQVILPGTPPPSSSSIRTSSENLSWTSRDYTGGGRVGLASQQLSLDVPLIHRRSQLQNFSNKETVQDNEKLKKPRKKRLGHFFRKRDPRRTKHVRTRGGEFVPGYLPGLSENDAKLMLSSCPKGTYLLYTTCNESDNFTFKLSVSLGIRQIWSCDIEATVSAGLCLISAAEGHEIRFSNLEDLATYYKTNALNTAGLVLKEPFLISRKLHQLFPC